MMTKESEKEKRRAGGNILVSAGGFPRVVMLSVSCLVMIILGWTVELGSNQ